MSGRRHISLRVMAAMLIALFGFAAASSASETRRIVIEIQSFQFVPSNVSVRPGDTVVWKNKDIVPHTATAKDASWDSGSIDAGGEVEVVVGAQWGASYYCAFHPSMTATLETVSP